MAREHRIEVVPSDDEIEQLDELRGGVPRAVWLRQAIHKPPEVKDIASYDEALAILTAMARDGKVTAASDLEGTVAKSERWAQIPPGEAERLPGRLLHQAERRTLALPQAANGQRIGQRLGQGEGGGVLEARVRR